MQHNLEDEIRMLNNNYLTNVFPYQSLAKAIKLQQQQINKLQSKVQQLLKSPQTSENDKQLLQSYQSTYREDALIHTRKFLQQSIVNEKKKFDNNYPFALHNLKEQIQDKSLSLDTDLNQMNALCSLESSWEVALCVAETLEKEKIERFAGMATTYDEMQPGKIRNIIEALNSKNK